MTRFNSGIEDWPRLLFENNHFYNLVFERAWEQCKAQHPQKKPDKEKLQGLVEAFSKTSTHIKSELIEFRRLLQNTPIVATIIHWILTIGIDMFLRDRYLTQLTQMQEKQLIPYVDQEGQLMTLDYFIKNGHQDILENIRCVKTWSFLEKEEIVRCYLAFTHHLARYTLGFIPESCDPDMERVRGKAIKYDIFLEFVQYLSGRDALIAKLLYFGAPSIEEVLHLQVKQINTRAYCVHFAGQDVIYPKHVIQHMAAEISAKSPEELCFLNTHGTAVDRIHLNHCFDRIGLKMSSTTERITPRGLLQLETVQR